MTHKLEQLLERNDIKDKIIESLKRTKETQREHVFNFCIKNGETIITDIEEGKQHNVGAENKCPIEDAKVVGAFHTHTKLINNDIMPSPKDVIKSVEEDLVYFCIGANKDGMSIIRCFNKTDLLLEINTILESAKKPITTENIDRAAKHIVERMSHDKKYLDRHSCTKLLTSNIDRR